MTRGLEKAMKKSVITVSLIVLVGLVSFAGASYWIGQEAKARYGEIVTRPLCQDSCPVK